MADGPRTLLQVLAASAGLIPLGLAMGFSPTLYAFTVRLLTQSATQAPRAIRWAMLGMAIGTVAQIALFRLVDPETIVAALKLRVEHALVTVWVDRVAGTVLLALGVAVLVRLLRGAPERAREAPARDGSEPARHLVVVGVVGSIGLSDVATTYVAGRLIASSTHHVPLQTIPLLVFLAVTVAPYLLLTWAWTRVPALAHAVTGAFDALQRLNRRALLAGGLLVAGLVFLALGTWGPDAAHAHVLPHRA